jgi:methionyl-tRNA formyltransferase
MSRLRIVFLGSDAIALPLLEWLAGQGAVQAEVVAVFTQPDRPVGRGQKVVPNAIKTWALGRGLPVHQPEKITPEVLGQFAALQPDVGLVMAYGHILREDFMATPRLGTLNLHTSLLPAYRGASPIQTAIASGETATGVSLMRIVRELDAGPVADVERIAIGPLDTAADVEARLAAACVPLLARALPRLADGSLGFTPQDRDAATFCRKLEKTDGALDFSVPATVLAARINGLFPWPACTFELNGQILKAGLADATSAAVECKLIVDVSEASEGGNRQLTDDMPPRPGTILGTDTEGVRVATGQGVLRLRRLQRPGGKMLAAGEFLRGFPLAAGTVIPSRPMAPLVGAAPFRR